MKIRAKEAYTIPFFCDSQNMEYGDDEPSFIEKCGPSEVGHSLDLCLDEK